jgi:hypothetical protein
MWKAFNSLFPLNTPLSEILPPAGQQGSVVNSSPRGTYSEWSLLGVCQPVSFWAAESSLRAWPDGPARLF